MAKTKSILAHDRPKKLGDPTIKEIDAAEHNFEVVRAAATKLRAGLQLNDGVALPGCESMDIKPVMDLLDNLGYVLRVLRRRIRDSQGLETAFSDDLTSSERTVPHTVEDSLSKMGCLCPLTVLLRLIADRLPNVQQSEHPIEQQGIDRLGGVVTSIGRDLRQPQGRRHWPGIAQCIVLCEENCVMKVAATAPQYHQLQGIQQAASLNRFRDLRMTYEACGREGKNRIGRVQQLSNRLRESLISNSDDQANPFAEEETRIMFRGVYRSLDPSGAVKPPCVLDQFRVQGNTAPEFQDAKAMHCPSATSCAEWELWLWQVRDSSD